MPMIALYTFTPAADRPYVDGSADNSAVAMVFGYNGLERFGISFPGSVASFGGGGPVERVAEAAGGGAGAGGSTTPAASSAAPAGGRSWSATGSARRSAGCTRSRC